MKSQVILELEIVETGGARYDSLRAAQAAALHPLVEALVAAIRAGVTSGRLVEQADGLITLAIPDVETTVVPTAA